MRNLLVPCQAINVFGSGGRVTQSEWVGNVIDVVDEELPLGTGRSENLGLQRVKLQSFDRASVLRRLRDESVGRSREKLLGIP